MSSISLPRVLQPRRGNSLDVERENFEKAQTLSIGKAVNSQENPVKEKHIRNAIIGSFQEKGAITFWSVVTKLPLQGNPIVCWKFCHTLHKLLREGHPNVIAESIKYKSEIEGLGRLWGHLKEGYGRLIACYTKLLIVKLDFHRRNPRFPGNLQVTADQLDDIGDRDVNNYFQLTVEMFDYMDEILSLQAAIFGSLDMSRSNSMTSSGQCRLAPLIPCIQDSSHLYDFCVKLLFKLHSMRSNSARIQGLPPDTLIGHSDRFRQQFHLLRQFYLNSSTLQYFKHLIQIPLLPENPPNFLVQADLSSHMSPVVILPPRAETPDNDSVDMMLVDTLSTTDESLSFPSNGTMSPDQLADKERLIDQLLREIEELKIEFQRIRLEDQRANEDLRRNILTLEAQVENLNLGLRTKSQETEQLQQKLMESQQSFDAAEKLIAVEKKAKAGEEKFAKMKEVYTKLREEHISLLRNKAEIEKQLNSAIKSSEDANQLRSTLKLKEDVETRHSELENELRVVLAEKMSLSENVNSLNKSKSELGDKLKQIEKEIETSRSQLVIRVKNGQRESLVSCIDEVESLLRNATIDVEANSSLQSTPEYLLSVIEPTILSLDRLAEEHSKFLSGGNADDVMRSVVSLGYLFGQTLVHSKATANASPDIEQGDSLMAASRDASLYLIEMLNKLKSKVDLDRLGDDINAMRHRVAKLTAVTEGLVSKISDERDVSELVEDELHSMDKAIEEAAARMEDLIRKSRDSDSAIKLEVNGKILDACTSLMQAIKVLVERSKVLQEEIVTQTKGVASAKEFYKRNHRWTEGLLSAAKAVGLGAKFLVNAADKVLNGEAKFEELMVASQEIAASTAQLVVASRVKANRNSENLTRLSQASRGVSEATGTVVATAKSCAQLMDESDVMDFTKLSLHQAKRLEMESQVRVLDLENQLGQERVKLARLRKQHYTLAGPSEGWEEEDIPE